MSKIGPVVRSGVLGVDPGVSGGAVVLSASGRVRVAGRLPELDRHLVEWLVWIKGLGPDVAVLERTYAGPVMSKMTARIFGEAVGRIKCALAVAGFAVVEVMPAQWQAALGLSTGGDKRVTRTAAIARWPETAWTHRIAEAAWLAEFGRVHISEDQWQRAKNSEARRVTYERPHRARSRVA